MKHIHHMSGTTPPTEGMVIHWAARYDAVVQMMTLGRAGRFRRRMADLLHVKQDDAVLDVGCGTGDLALVLAQRIGAYGSVLGIDPAPEMIARAQRKAQRRHSRATFQVGVAEALPCAPHSFDQVVTSLVLHHLPGELKHRALASMAQVLKPGGQLTIVDFINHAGNVQGHRGAATDPIVVPEGLDALGFAHITSGPLGNVPGLPPLMVIQARMAG
jgi:demethylmenaquinone methyltransferase/2-methoxy-6-polyprenyl-1,4-benzoquinol methylase/phosphoethanolamine N-methyltransferase